MLIRYVVEKIEQHKFESNVSKGTRLLTHRWTYSNPRTDGWAPGKGSLVLLVRWDGYDEPTWEPEANMCVASYTARRRL